MSEKKKNNPLWNALAKKASGLKQSVTESASEAGKSIRDKASEAAKQKVSQVGEMISHTASEAGKSLTERATEVTDSLTNKASEAGKTLMETATGSVGSTVKRTQDWVEQLAQEPDNSFSPYHVPDWSLDELYHVFIAYSVAQKGGTKTVTLKSGKNYTVRIPPNRSEGSNLRLKKCGLNQNDAFLVLHSLYNPDFNFDRQINRLIVQASLYETSKIRCLEAYNRINFDQATDDFAALDLLDYLVSGSKLASDLGQRYVIGSQNSRLLGLEKCLETALKAANLSLNEQLMLRSTYQYFKAAEAVENLQALTQLDAIILNSSLKPALKKYYIRASAMCRALATDLVILKQLYERTDITEEEKNSLISLYIKIREKQTIVDEIALERLERFIFEAEIPISCKVIYKIIRGFYLPLDDEFEPDDFTESYKIIQQIMESFQQDSAQNQAETTTLNVSDIKPGMLMETAYNCVSRGGLGLLGEQILMKGTTSLLESSARVAIALVSQLTKSEKINLGIAAVAETDTATTAMGENWKAVGSFGGTETRISHLFGATAYREIMIEIGGVSHWDEESQLSSQNLGLGFLQFLKGNPDKQRLIQELETRLYC